MRKLSYTEVKNFENRYYAGKYPNQRLGQAFYNEFLDDVADEVANLFYVGDEKEAKKIIWANYWNGEAENI